MIFVLYAGEAGHTNETHLLVREAAGEKRMKNL